MPIVGGGPGGDDGSDIEEDRKKEPEVGDMAGYFSNDNEIEEDRKKEQDAEDMPGYVGSDNNNNDIEEDRKKEPELGDMPGYYGSDLETDIKKEPEEEDNDHEIEEDRKKEQDEEDMPGYKSNIEEDRKKEPEIGDMPGYYSNDNEIEEDRKKEQDAEDMPGYRGDSGIEEDRKKEPDLDDMPGYYDNNNNNNNIDGLTDQETYNEWVSVEKDRISVIDGKYHVAIDGLNVDNGDCNEYSVIIGVLSLLLMLAVGYIFKMKYNAKKKYFGEKYENYNSINIESHGNQNEKMPLIE